MDDEDNLALEEELFGTGAHAQDGHHDRDEGKTVDYLQFEPTTSHRTHDTLSVSSTANEGKDASSSAEPGPLPIPPQRSMSVSLLPSMTNQKGPSLAAAVIHEWHTSCFMSARQALAAHTQERLQKSMGGRGSESDIRMAAALRTEELRLLHLAEQERERSEAERVTRAIEGIRTGGKGGPTEHPLAELFAPLLASSASVALEGWEVILLSVLDSNAHSCEAKALLLTPYMEALLRIPPQLLSKDTSFTHHPSSLPGVDRHPLGAAMTRFLLVFESLYYTHTHVHTPTHAHTHSGEGNGKSTRTTGAVKVAETDGDKREAGPTGGGDSGGGRGGKGDARGTAGKQATIASTATLKAAAHNLTQRHSPGHTRQSSGGERDLSAHYVDPRADVDISDMTTDVRAFLQLVKIGLKRLFPRIAETQEHLNLLEEVADRTIFKLLPQPLQVLIHVRRTDEEMLLERLTRMLASEQGEKGPENSIAVRHLNVSADYRLDGAGAEGPVQPSQNYTERSRASYAPAISELLSMSLCTYPVDKARHLAAAFRLIPRCVAQYYKTQAASASPDPPTPTHTDTHTPPQPLCDVVDAMASDDLLPVLELLVVLCYTHTHTPTHAHGCAMPLRDLPAHLEYIDRLLPDNFKDSEEGYCVVSLTAAVADLMEGVKYH